MDSRAVDGDDAGGPVTAATDCPPGAGQVAARRPVRVDDAIAPAPVAGGAVVAIWGAALAFGFMQRRGFYPDFLAFWYAARAWLGGLDPYLVAPSARAVLRRRPILLSVPERAGDRAVCAGLPLTIAGALFFGFRPASWRSRHARRVRAAAAVPELPVRHGCVPGPVGAAHHGGGVAPRPWISGGVQAQPRPRARVRASVACGDLWRRGAVRWLACVRSGSGP